MIYFDVKIDIPGILKEKYQTSHHTLLIWDPSVVIARRT